MKADNQIYAFSLNSTRHCQFTFILPIQLVILPLVILPLVNASKSLSLVTFTCRLTLVGRTTIAWARRGWTTTAGLSRALAVCFSSPLLDPPSPPLPFSSLYFSSTPYSIAPSPFLLFSGSQCRESAGWTGANERAAAGAGERWWRSGGGWCRRPV
jgi:hypothetical protein